MKQPLILLLLTSGSLLVSSCSNVAIIGQRERIGIDAEFNGASPTPVDIIFGQTQQTVIAVPPKAPNRDGGIHQGDLLSTSTAFTVIPEEDERFHVKIKSSVFTGRAANVLTGSSDEGKPGTAVRSPSRAGKSYNRHRKALQDELDSLERKWGEGSPPTGVSPEEQEAFEAGLAEAKQRAAQIDEELAVIDQRSAMTPQMSMAEAPAADTSAEEAQAIARKLESVFSDSF